MEEANGEGADGGDGEGDVVETPFNPKITLPLWQAKALGPARSNFNKGSTVPLTRPLP